MLLGNYQILLILVHFVPKIMIFGLKYLPSIPVLHLPSAIGNGLISIAVGNAVAVACIIITIMQSILYAMTTIT